MARPSLLATSDLHVTHEGNQEVLERIRPQTDGDWLIVAGDIAHLVSDVERTLRLLRNRFAKVIWAPGNHELWTAPTDPVQLRGEARYQHLVEVCRRLDVLTPEDEYAVWPGVDEELVVVPLFLLYDYSWRPDGMTIPQALEHGRSLKVVCNDEFYLHPDPYETRQDWAAHRLRLTRARLDAELDPELSGGRRTVLVSHWPLHREPTRILRWPHFAMWCGTDATADWHLRYRAAAAVYGHLHIPRPMTIDGVRFEEVSLGYPREWRSRGPQPPNPVVRIELGEILSPPRRASFSALDPVALLRFAEHDAPSVLTEGNEWLGLVDNAAARMRRSPSPPDREVFAETAMIALDGLRAHTRMPDEHWAPRAMKVRVDWTLLSEQSDSARRLNASMAYGIFLDRLQVLGVDPLFVDEEKFAPNDDQLKGIRRLASLLSRISQYLTAEQQLTINSWLDGDQM